MFLKKIFDFYISSSIHVAFATYAFILLSFTTLNSSYDYDVAHFDEENLWMNETNFPAKECHIDEHAAVLKSIMEVNDLVISGDNSQCLRLSIALMDWFPGHADYLDSALAHWMCKQRLGGKPIVLRRSIASGS